MCVMEHVVHSVTLQAVDVGETRVVSVIMAVTGHVSVLSLLTVQSCQPACCTTRDTDDFS